MSSAPPAISVVVPSFNHAEFIRDTLDSILIQGYPAIEIHVMDGGSSDGTVDILKSYGSKISWVSEKDDGQTDALIKGFAKCTGDVLTWLNSDDIMCERSLWLVGETAQRQDAAVIYGRGHYMSKDGERGTPYPTVEISAAYSAEQAFFEKGYVAQPSVYFRRTAYDRVGGLNPAKKLCMDYDLWVRLSRAGCRWVFIDNDISGNRWYQDTKTASQALDLLGECIGTQIWEYGRVSSYFVQAISDHLYTKLHSKHFGDQEHLLVRSLLFKALWCVLNYRTPKRAIEGLLFRNIATSGPVVADYISQDQFLDALKARLGGAG